MRSRRSPVVGLIERKSYQAGTATSSGGGCSIDAMPPLKIAVALAVLLAIGTDTAVAATVRVEPRYDKAAYAGEQPEEGEDVEGDEDTIEAELTISGE